MVSHISNGSSSHFPVNSSKKLSLTVPETLRALGKGSSVIVQIKATMLRNALGLKGVKAEAGVS